jgi:hypothetical protein
VDRHPAILVVEHGNELQASAERIEVLTQRRNPYIVGMLELGNRPRVTSSRPASSAWPTASA